MKLTDNYMTEREAFTTMGIEVPTFDQVDPNVGALLGW